jgi:hypothetical protein
MFRGAHGGIDPRRNEMMYRGAAGMQWGSHPTQQRRVAGTPAPNLYAMAQQRGTGYINPNINPLRRMPKPQPKIKPDIPGGMDMSDFTRKRTGGINPLRRPSATPMTPEKLLKSQGFDAGDFSRRTAKKPIPVKNLTVEPAKVNATRSSVANAPGAGQSQKSTADYLAEIAINTASLRKNNYVVMPANFQN